MIVDKPNVAARERGGYKGRNSMGSIMRGSIVVGLVVLASGPALAQPAPQPSTPGQSNKVPVDVGPDTPAANDAYQGGGVILQGAPGAPAPKATATPPGEKPRNMIPPPQ